MTGSRRNRTRPIYTQVYRLLRLKKLLDIYKNPRSKIFPPVEYMDFIWDKQKYLTRFKQNKIPINDYLIC